QLDRLGDRGDHRPVLAADAVDGLETDSHAGQEGLLTDRPEPIDDDVARPIGVAISGGPGQADDTAGAERCQPVQGRTDGLHARRSSLATSVPEPAPRPGPGQVLAPMWYRPSTGVRWPGWAANGRQRKFWSSASEPPYGSPCARLGFAAWRSAGESATRLRIAPSRFGACLAIRC